MVKRRNTETLSFRYSGFPLLRLPATQPCPLHKSPSGA